MSIDTNAPSHSLSALSRRKFLVGAATTTATIGAMQGIASAQEVVEGAAHSCDATCETITVWRLDPDWGYPRGPHGKTRLESKASRNAAKYRWALTKQDALDMNLHKCSWAPAVPVEVNECAFMEIWDHNGAGHYEWSNPWNNIDVPIFDERCLTHIDNSDVLWEQALNQKCDEKTTTTTTTRTITSGGSYASDLPTFDGSNYGTTSRTPESLAFADNGRSTSNAASSSGQLAYTGSETAALTGAGAAFVVAGAAFKRFADRKERVAAASLFGRSGFESNAALAPGESEAAVVEPSVELVATASTEATDHTAIVAPHDMATLENIMSWAHTASSPHVVVVETMTIQRFDSLTNEVRHATVQDAGNFLTKLSNAVEVAAWIDGPYFMLALSDVDGEDLRMLEQCIRRGLSSEVDGVDADGPQSPEVASLAGTLCANRESLMQGSVAALHINRESRQFEQRYNLTNN